MNTATAKKEISEIPQTTPMLRQYLEIKAQHSDAILFYRLGDFYEMFFEDAVQASKVLDITLTTRNKNDDNPVPLCGVPYHSSEGYIAKLIADGRKVVVCEQVEDPKLAKGLVRREVTRIITPGTVLEAQSLTATSPNFLMCLKKDGATYVCAVCDVTTGKLDYFSLTGIDQVKSEITRLGIKELLYSETLRDDVELKRLLHDHGKIYHHAVSDLYFDGDFARELISNYYKVKTLAGLDLPEASTTVSVLGGLFGYLKDSKLLTPDLIQQPVERRLDEQLFLDATTVAHLELFSTQQDGKRHGTLVWHLDECFTAMGARKLVELVRAPLLNVEEINQRLSAVQELIDKPNMLESLTSILVMIADLERLANRFVLRTANARDALALSASLKNSAQVKNLLTTTEVGPLKTLADTMNTFDTVIDDIDRSIQDDAPLSLRDGGFIRDGISAELDELRAIEKNGKDFILGIERRERERTGITSLKIRYNNIFGYYIEITNAHKEKTPPDYIRKQTLANAERYITDELKNYEAKVLGASERIKTLEIEIFTKLMERIAVQATAIKSTADAIALTDVFGAFAVIAKKYRYVRPVLTNKIVIDLKGARHPILERLNSGENFVPNDVALDSNICSEMIITGPNMAGKSTLMRMVALISLMGQMGSFVPCEKATLGVCDRLFTRVGAHDHLQKGLSTFMVEMVETAKILREATPRSLILLDEIGRGTSTFDGLSIAWAVAEDLHDRLHARTLFATHYHELCDLAAERKGIKNLHMAVKEWNGEIIFLRKLASGGTNRSYGVVVAGMAGLPPTVIRRAKDILKLLELKDLSFQNGLGANTGNEQLSLFQEPESDIIKELRSLDINRLTPLEALSFLAGLKEKL